MLAGPPNYGDFMRSLALLTLVLFLGTSACGGSFAHQWSFESADVQTEVSSEGEVAAMVGVLFSAYGFSGRLEVGLDTATAEVLLCFVQDPDTDPLPVCYTVPISRWEDPAPTVEEPAATEDTPEPTEGLPPEEPPATEDTAPVEDGVDIIEGEEAVSRMRRAGMLG